MPLLALLIGGLSIALIKPWLNEQRAPQSQAQEVSASETEGRSDTATRRDGHPLRRVLVDLIPEDSTIELEDGTTQPNHSMILVPIGGIKLTLTSPGFESRKLFLDGTQTEVSLGLKKAASPLKKAKASTEEKPPVRFENSNKKESSKSDRPIQTSSTSASPKKPTQVSTSKKRLLEKKNAPSLSTKADDDDLANEELVDPWN